MRDLLIAIAATVLGGLILAHVTGTWTIFDATPTPYAAGNIVKEEIGRCTLWIDAGTGKTVNKECRQAPQHTAKTNYHVFDTETGQWRSDKERKARQRQQNSN